MIRTACLSLLLGAGCVFGALYYAQYFKWRDCFNAQGRCFDPASGTVYLAQSGPIWLALMLGCFAAALWVGLRRRG